MTAALQLQNVSLFEGLPADDLRALGERAQFKRLAGDTVVIREGDMPDAFYVIISGRVKVYLLDDDGTELELDTKGAGQYFGEMMLDDNPRSASVKTLEASEFAVISRAEFKSFLLKHPEVSLQVIRNLIRLARGANESARTREHLRKYVDELKAGKLKPPASLARWVAARRWALGALLVVAILVFYYTDVLIALFELQRLPVFTR